MLGSRSSPLILALLALAHGARAGASRQPRRLNDPHDPHHAAKAAAAGAQGKSIRRPGQHAPADGDENVGSKGQHQYAQGDNVDLIANNVGPFANPTETYPYYSLPFCEPDVLEHQSHSLGELLAGDRKVRTHYDVRFRVPVKWRELCKKTLDRDDIDKFAKAIEEEYYFEMFLDGLPIWGYVGDAELVDYVLGRTDRSHRYIYTHLHFNVGYNGDRVVEVNVTANPAQRVDITDYHDKVDVQFTYSVGWEERAGIAFDARMERYTRMHFLPASFEIHWLSIINSFVLVILLTVFLSIILMRVLKNDFTRYMREDGGGEGELLLAAGDGGDGGAEETGWKLLHGDVFRHPSGGWEMWFSACIGAGAQLLLMVAMLLVLALMGMFVPTKRGAVATAVIVLYALTSCVGGYLAARLYRQLGGTNWVWNIVLANVLFPGPLFVMFCFLNSVAVGHSSTAALPFGTILVVFALFLLVAFPLGVVGGVAGRNSTPVGEFKTPCRTTKVPRQIPHIPCYRRGCVQMLLAGFLPFSAIYIELHYIFAAVWGHKIYTLFGILFLAFLMLVIVTSFITIALTYFQLAAEDHRWWWRSFASGGSTGFFIYAYCFFYYFHRSEMFGFMQTSFYFGYMALCAYAFFLMLGCVGWFSSLVFVRHIYGAIKTD